MRQHPERIVHSCFSCKFSFDKSCRSCLVVRRNFHFYTVTCPPPSLPRSRALCTRIFIFESILCGLLLSQQILKLHDSSFFYALLHGSIHHSVMDLDAVCPCVIPGKGPRPRAGRAVFPAAKQCRPTIPLIPWSSAESTSRPQVNLANAAVHTQAQRARAATCVFCKVLFFFSFVLFFFKINYGVVSFSAYRVSVYRGYRRLSS